jgi:hypothetical protein
MRDTALGKLLGVLGIALSWGAAWGVLFATLFLVVGIVQPEDIDGGEGLVPVSGIGALVGFVSGTVFGVIESIAENRKSIGELRLKRVAVWGIVSSGVWPLLTAVDNGMVMILCPVGAACAVTAVAIARRAERDGSEGTPVLGVVGRFVASPLKAACSSNG